MVPGPRVKNDSTGRASTKQETNKGRQTFNTQSSRSLRCPHIGNNNAQHISRSLLSAARMHQFVGVTDPDLSACTSESGGVMELQFPSCGLFRNYKWSPPALWKEDSSCPNHCLAETTALKEDGYFGTIQTAAHHAGCEVSYISADRRQ